MNKVIGLDEQSLAAATSVAQTARVTVLVAYPQVTAAVIKLTPQERKEFITQKMRLALDAVLALKLLVSWKLLRSPGHRGRYHGVQGEINLADLQKLVTLECIATVQVESINGRASKPTKPRKSQRFYCVKMTVAIQIEGRTQGRQTYEERYVLFKAYTEADALQKAKKTCADYSKPYLNADGLLVRWKVEGLDSVYEVVMASGAKDRQNLDGAEVFSVLKSRNINSERAW